MQYRPRVPQEEVEWIKQRIAARGEECQEWATYLHMSKSQLSHIFDQTKPVPARSEIDWECMKRILREKTSYERGRENELRSNKIC